MCFNQAGSALSRSITCYTIWIAVEAFHIFEVGIDWTGINARALIQIKRRFALSTIIRILIIALGTKRRTTTIIWNLDIAVGRLTVKHAN